MTNASCKYCSVFKELNDTIISAFLIYNGGKVIFFKRREPHYLNFLKIMVEWKCSGGGLS